MKDLAARNSWLVIVAGLLLSGASGCQGGLFGNRSSDDATQEPGEIDAVYNISQVVSVDRRLNYVILRTLGASFPPDGTSLPLYRDGERIGTVRISGSEQEGHIPADVLDGSPLYGDFVLLEPIESSN